MHSERGPGGSPGRALTFRPPSASDGCDTWTLARRNGLDENSPYAYLLWAEYFRSASTVAERDGELVGFVNGFQVPDRPDTLFVWQVAVDDSMRGSGVASAMLEALLDRCPWMQHLEATVNPSNVASAALFRRFGSTHGADVEEQVLFDEALFPPGDHEAEVRFRIGPLRRC